MILTTTDINLGTLKAYTELKTAGWGSTRTSEYYLTFVIDGEDALPVASAPESEAPPQDSQGPPPSDGAGPESTRLL